MVTMSYDGTLVAQLAGKTTGFVQVFGMMTVFGTVTKLDDGTAITFSVGTETIRYDGTSVGTLM
jgi:hypothetical protein